MCHIYIIIVRCNNSANSSISSDVNLYAHGVIKPIFIIRIGLDKIRQKYTNYKCAGTATMADKRFRTFLSRTQKKLARRS